MLIIHMEIGIWGTGSSTKFSRWSILTQAVMFNQIHGLPHQSDVLRYLPGVTILMYMSFQEIHRSEQAEVQSLKFYYMTLVLAQ